MLSSVASSSSDLRPHQASAIKAALTHLIDQNSDRGQLLMTCGTGKTRTAIRLAEALAAAHVLVLVLNLSLLAQTLKEWREHSRSPFRDVAVCSDHSVADQWRTGPCGWCPAAAGDGPRDTSGTE